MEADNIKELEGELLTAKQVARVLQCNHFSVYRLAYQKALPTVKIGPMRRFRKRDVMALITGEAVPSQKETQDERKPVCA